MKLTKLLALLLALTLVFTLAACGNGNNDDPSGSQQGTNAPLNREDDTSSTENQGGTQSGNNNPSNVGDIDIGSIMSGNGSTDTVYGQLDEASKQQIISDLESEGYDVSFGTDGSMTIVDPDGTTMVQKADGTWVVKDEDGGEGQIGGDWPDNEFTKLIPKPDFELFAANTETDSFSVAFTSATIEQIKDYAAKVKAAGFNINEEVEDQEVMGMVIYSFTAENADGYTVEITSANGTSALTISK
ncbi:MAG: hypothetical protein J6K31_14950 [Parabacteroides sp.]|nr:hypothetical protein [Parabacteroides sp.]